MHKRNPSSNICRNCLLALCVAGMPMLACAQLPVLEVEQEMTLPPETAEATKTPQIRQFVVQQPADAVPAESAQVSELPQMPQLSPVPQALQVPQVPQVPRQSLTFMDSRLFDAQLSKELDAGKENIEIDILGKVTLSALPGRLDKWITRVGETGSVEVRENTVRTRNFFGLLPMIFSGFQALSEERTLSPAKNYDLSILYRRDQSGETVIERVVFKRKKPQP